MKKKNNPRNPKTSPFSGPELCAFLRDVNRGGGHFLGTVLGPAFSCFFGSRSRRLQSFHDGRNCVQEKKGGAVGLSLSRQAQWWSTKVSFSVCCPLEASMFRCRTETSISLVRHWSRVHEKERIQHSTPQMFENSRGHMTAFAWI